MTERAARVARYPVVRIARFAAGAVALVVIVVLAVGYLLPQNHVASASRTVSAPPAHVFARITNVADYPRWRSDVQKVEVIGSAPLTWTEHAGSDVITYDMLERIPSERIVTRIADSALPFGGTWTYELRADGAGTHVTITERGEVYNPVFRFMSRFVFGHTGSIQRVLQALAQ